MRRNDSPSPPDEGASPLDRTWPRTRRRAELLRLPSVPTLVVAAHPGDETLLAGGLIATQRTRRVDVHVLAVTDGEGTGESAVRHELEPRRRAEQAAALDVLGVGAAATSRLGIRDGTTAEHTADIADAIAAFDHVVLVVAPWSGDHQCDHEAVGTAARETVARTGGALISGLFWAWHRQTPADLTNERVLALELDENARRRRRRAIDCHRSRLATGVPPVTSGSSGVQT
jgi:LmbE family N-acetylglucosaminyl deacetylase